MLIEKIKTYLVEIYENNNFSLLKEFIIENTFGLILGIAVATLVFIIRNSKFTAGLKEKKRILSNVKKIMKKEDVEFDEAKEFLIAYELGQNMELDEKAWTYNGKDMLYSGHKVSFRDKEIGNVIGYFIGIVTPDLFGYEPLYVLRLRDGTIRKAPISFVEVDTIYVYENKKR